MEAIRGKICTPYQLVMLNLPPRSLTWCVPRRNVSCLCVKRIWEEKKATKNEREQCGVVGFGEVEEKGWMYLEKL